MPSDIECHLPCPCLKADATRIMVGAKQANTKSASSSRGKERNIDILELREEGMFLNLTFLSELTELMAVKRNYVH